MGDLLRRAVSVKKKNKQSSVRSEVVRGQSVGHEMPSPATFTSSAAAIPVRQSAASTCSTTSASPQHQKKKTTAASEGRTSLSSNNRSRFNSLSSKATSSEDNLFSSSLESNTSSFLDTNDQRVEETMIQVYYDSAEVTGQSPTSASSSQTLRPSDEEKRPDWQTTETIVDMDLSASDLSDSLAIKCNLKGKHHLVAQIPSLSLERVIDDDEEVLPLVVSGLTRVCCCDATSTSPSAARCHWHRRSASQRHASERSPDAQRTGIRPVDGTSVPQSEQVQQAVRQQHSQETTGSQDVRFILKKSASTKYGFMDRPQDFLCLNLIQFNSWAGERGGGQEPVLVDANEKAVLVQEMIRFGRDVPPLTVSGILTYKGRPVRAEVTVSSANSQETMLLRCRSEKSVKQETDTLFPSAHYDVFVPISDHRDEQEAGEERDAIAPVAESMTAAKGGREPECRFALCRSRDSEPEPVHWFSCESEEQRTTFLTCMTMVRHGLKTLRQKAKHHAKQFPIVFDIVPPASYNDASSLQQQQSTYSGMDAGNDASSIKWSNVSRASRSRRSRDESVSIMLKKHSPEYEPWFYPDLGRDEATVSLSKYASVDGVFLVRLSERTPGSSVLSFVANGKVTHVTMQNVDADHGQVVVSLDGGVTKFYDLKQLIEFYQLNQGSLPTRLTHFLVHK